MTKAICEDCNQEMLGSKSCTHKLIEFSKYQVRERNTTYFDVNDNCHDCGIENKPGNVHHFGCDMERCPLCEGQLLSCECREKYEVIPLENMVDGDNMIDLLKDVRNVGRSI